MLTIQKTKIKKTFSPTNHGALYNWAHFCPIVKHIWLLAVQSHMSFSNQYCSPIWQCSVATLLLTYFWHRLTIQDFSSDRIKFIRTSPYPITSCMHNTYPEVWAFISLSLIFSSGGRSTQAHDPTIVQSLGKYATVRPDDRISSSLNFS